MAMQPPDGGWGWVIVICSFLINFLSFGTMFSIGIIFDSLMTEFNCTASQVSVMASTAFSLQCFLGPIVSMLHDRFGTRPVVFVGALVISLSFVLSAFAPNIIYLYVIFGIFGGAGMALAYLPVIVTISYYFDKRRSLATALGGIGAYAGCFIHPYLIKFLVSIYGWRGALFVIGALVLNSLALSMLLRPVNQSTTTKNKLAVDEEAGLADDGNEARRLKTFIETNITGCKEEEEPAESVFTAPSHETGGEEIVNLDVQKQRQKQKRTLSERLVTNDEPDVHQFRRYISEGNRRCRSPSNNPPKSKDDSDVVRKRSAYLSFGGIYTTRVLESQISTEAARSVKKAQAAYVRSLSRMVGRSKTPTISTTVEEEIAPEEPDDASRLTIFVRPYVEIFRNPEFAIFLVANFLICLVFYTPSLFIVDWGTQIGISSEGTTLLLSLVGIGNIVGRPVVAFIGDLMASHRTLLFTLMVAITGTVTAITPIFPNFYFLAFFVFQFAFLTGGSQNLLTPMLADMVSLNRLGFAFGILIAAEGIGILLGPPLLVLLPSYTSTFTTAGFILDFSALLIVVVFNASRLCCLCHLIKSEEESRANDNNDATTA